MPYNTDNYSYPWFIPLPYAISFTSHDKIKHTSKPELVDIITRYLYIQNKDIMKPLFNNDALTLLDQVDFWIKQGKPEKWVDQQLNEPRVIPWAELIAKHLYHSFELAEIDVAKVMGRSQSTVSGWLIA